MLYWSVGLWKADVADVLQMTVNPLKDSELIFYGGEYYNGDKVSKQNNRIVFVIVVCCLA